MRPDDVFNPVRQLWKAGRGSPNHQTSFSYELSFPLSRRELSSILRRESHSFKAVPIREGGWPHPKIRLSRSKVGPRIFIPTNFKVEKLLLLVRTTLWEVNLVCLAGEYGGCSGFDVYKISIFLEFFLAVTKWIIFIVAWWLVLSCTAPGIT